MMAPSRTTAAVAVAALLIAAGGAAASTGPTQYPTFFTKFKFKGGELFAGEISSPKGGCVGGRKVKLFLKQNGNQNSLGGDKTDSKGKFKIELSGGPLQEGKYYAKVKQDRLGNGDVCLKKQSGYVKVTIN